jgi:hypothetical protein
MIKDRQGELASRFQREHGRPPTPVEALQLAQQASLATRGAKHEPRSLAEQRTAWHAQAAETLGGPRAVEGMITWAAARRSVARDTLASAARTCGAGRREQSLRKTESRRSVRRQNHPERIRSREI